MPSEGFRDAQLSSPKDIGSLEASSESLSSSAALRHCHHIQ